MRRWLVRIAIVGVLLPVMATAGLRSSPGTACEPTWRVVAHKGVPDLAAVDAVAAAEVWAVGTAEGDPNTSADDRPAIVRWDGEKTSTETLSWRHASFYGVSAVSESDIWAVGQSKDVPMAAHFDGNRWMQSRLPLSKKGALTDVSAVGADDVWAVGWAYAGPDRTRPVLLHWDGRHWQLVDIRRAAPRLDELYSIDSAAADEVWTFGSTGPNAGNGYGYGPVFVRWDGRRWMQLSAGFGIGEYKNPLAAGAVDVAPSGEVWTVHSEAAEGGSDTFVRFSGRTGRVGATYRWPGQFNKKTYEKTVYAVTAVSASDVWAVGLNLFEDSDMEFPLVGHWTGRFWRIQPTPFGHLEDASLADASTLSTTDIWAVGPHLIVRYSCST